MVLIYMIPISIQIILAISCINYGLNTGNTWSVCLGIISLITVFILADCLRTLLYLNKMMNETINENTRFY
ncbi:hypothetical protein A9264_09380 [Vibrio sp. UCD-FRSSP16_10]|nr:hypothetical protein A9260_09605 [Vibrio sp. UCD-FRSSP16_30]OBT21923.1 hypothetical protein A9264_09380 [Vibrio sp. UCD-FRSSP16_10]